MRLSSVLLATASLLCVTALAATAAGTQLHGTAPVAPAKKPLQHAVHHVMHHMTHHKAKVVSVKHLPPSEQGVAVALDEVRVVKFNRPVATVYIGNPVIADATVIDANHIFVLGKSFGTTNLIALDSHNQLVASQRIAVTNRSGGVVTLNKGPNQFTYACTGGRCDPGPVPGDQPAFFNDNSGTVSAHQEQNVKAAEAK